MSPSVTGSGESLGWPEAAEQSLSPGAPWRPPKFYSGQKLLCITKNKTLLVLFVSKAGFALSSSPPPPQAPGTLCSHFHPQGPSCPPLHTKKAECWAGWREHPLPETCNSFGGAGNHSPKSHAGAPVCQRPCPLTWRVWPFIHSRVNCLVLYCSGKKRSGHVRRPPLLHIRPTRPVRGGSATEPRVF